MAKLVGIESIGEYPVYDITVAEHHNFIANGVVVHNCMRVAQELSGFTPGESYRFVKTIAKKIPEKMAALKRSTVALGEQTRLPDDYLTFLYRNEEAFAALQEDIRSAAAVSEEVDIIFYYNGEPVMYPQVARTVSVECRKGGVPVDSEVELTLPAGWDLLDEYTAGIETNFEVVASKLEDSSTFEVRVYLNGRTHTAKFVMLGPEAAKGFPSRDNVPRCPKCGGREGSCVCDKG